MTLNILPNAKTQFLDGNAVPLAGGFVHFYIPSTTTPKTTWQDSAGTNPNTNPVVLDGNGEALIWGSGAYRQVVTDSLGSLIWDQITIDPGYAVVTSFSGTSLSSNTIGTGNLTFLTQPGLQFFPGGILIAASATTPTSYVLGSVVSYNTVTGSLVLNSTQTNGSGTYSSWNISISGVQGPPGTVTAVSVTTANGLAGTSSGGSTPQLALSTTVTGVLKGNGTAISAATAGTDYSVGTAVLATGIVKNTTGTGALSIAIAADFPTLNQNTTGTAATVTTNANLTGPVTSVGNATTIANGAVTEAKLGLTNVTTGNVTTSAHGFTPILPNDSTKFLNGVGGYTAPVVNFTVGTSTTSLLIGTGTKTYTTQAGLSISPGQYLIIPSNANSANFMYGSVTSYSGTSLVMNISQIGGSGTFADWNILVSGPPGVGGTVSSVSITSANGFAGTVANPTTTPAITVSTSITGILKGNGAAISAATSGTDYSAGTSGNTTGIVKSTTGTGALTTAIAADFPTLNQSTSGNAATATALATARTIAITGDLTYTSPSFDGSGNVTAAGTLATVNSNVGTFNNANITVNGKGLITAITAGTGFPAAVVGTLSGASTTFTVDFTTYSEYTLMISHATDTAGGLIKVDVSTDGGSTYKTATRNGQQQSIGATTALATAEINSGGAIDGYLYGVISQPSTAALSNLNYNSGQFSGTDSAQQGVTTYNSSAAINRVKISTANLFTAGSVILQPISAR